MDGKKMCGICGIILSDHTNSSFSVGALLYKMMESQQVRAQDSAGIAIYNDDYNYQVDSSLSLAYLMKVGSEYELREEKTNLGPGYPKESDQLVARLKKDETVS